MPFIFKQETTAMSGQIADKDWFLDAEGNLTDSGETGASYLVREGQEITAEMAESRPVDVVSNVALLADGNSEPLRSTPILA